MTSDKDHQASVEEIAADWAMPSTTVNRVLVHMTGCGMRLTFFEIQQPGKVSHPRSSVTMPLEQAKKMHEAMGAILTAAMEIYNRKETLQ